MAHHEVLVVGGGNAGVSLAAKLLRDGATDVALVEPQPTHRYRPLLNYVGVGEATMAELERPAADVVPRGCTWVQDEVVAVDPDRPAVRTAGGREITCSTLVVCPGLEEDWAAVPGLAEAYAAGWAGSTFVVDSVTRVWPALSALRAGRVVFTVPVEPAPCGATALKPLLTACDHWRRHGVLEELDVWLLLPGERPLGERAADRVVEQALARYGVHVLRCSRVSGLGDRVVGVTSEEGHRELTDVDYAHVVPHYRAPHWVVESGLAGATAAGLVDVDPETLRHRTRPGVWALGDVADLRTPSSGGALRRQVEVLAHNLRATDASDLRRYDGYTVMPITLDRQRLLLLEVDREGRRRPTVPWPDLVTPRRATRIVDRRLLPITYFRRILRGRV